MIKSKDDNAYSFIMGVDSDFKDRLDEMGATYIIDEGKYFLTTIPKESLPDYEVLISNNLKPGFWNEYIGDIVVFIFKTKEGKILRFELNSDNEKEIMALCNEYAGFNKKSVEEMLLAEPFYKENTILY